MLLDKDNWQSYVRKDEYVSDFFYHFEHTTPATYRSGEEEMKMDENALNLLTEIFTGWVSTGYFSRLNLKTYLISDTFYDALRKSWKVLVPLMDEDGIIRSLHEDSCIIYKEQTFLMWRDPVGDGYHYMALIDHGKLLFFSSYTFDDKGVSKSHSLSFMYLHDYYDSDIVYIEAIYAFLLFKRYGNIDIETVAAKKTLRRSRIIGEKVNNFMGIDVQVLDSRWFTTICRDEGFLVSGHFRLQPCKDEHGEWTRKLIYINPYAKHGYHRMATIVNIKKQ